MIKVGDKVRLSVQYKRYLCSGKAGAWGRKLLADRGNNAATVIRIENCNIDYNDYYEHDIIDVKWPDNFTTSLYAYKFVKVP